MSERNTNEQLEEVLRRYAAMFFERESNRDALLSVTRVTLAQNRKEATILISVLPENKEQAVLAFAKRNRKELREYLKKELRGRMVPFVDVELDLGEKNRQHLEKIVG